MGTLAYATAGLEIEFDDRVLAHLQVVVVAKLRRNEGFVFSWKAPSATGDGRSAVWMDRSIPLVFTYDTPETPALNRQWLELLTVTANGPGGLRIVEEPVAPETPQRG